MGSWFPENLNPFYSKEGYYDDEHFFLFSTRAISLYTSLFTDLDPCLDVNCPSFGVCKTYNAHEARCVCFEDCPSYQNPVCTANGTTYDNKCWHELSYCRGLDNNTVYHPGSCEGKGIKRLLQHTRKYLFILVVMEEI